MIQLGLFLRDSRFREALKVLSLYAVVASVAVGSFWGAAVGQTRSVGPAGMSLDQAEANWTALSANEKFAIIKRLVRVREFVRAEGLLLRSRFKTADQHVASRFLLGLIEKGKGNLERAESIFREILSAFPGFSEARLVLAQVLYERQNDQSAKHHFRLVLSEAASKPGLRGVVNDFIGAIDRRRRWGLSAYFTLAPSTNFNQGSENKTVELNGLPFTLDEDDQKKSGLGIAAGINGSYRQPVTERIDVIATAGVNTKRYKEDNFNELSVSSTLGPRYRFDWGTMGLYAKGVNRWSGDEQYRYELGGLFQTHLRWGPADLGQVDFECAKHIHEDDFNGDDLTYNDGYECQVYARHDHYFDATTFVRLMGAYSQEQREVDHLDNQAWSVGIGAYREFPFGLTLYGQGNYTRSDYDGIFPGISEAREDDRFDASLTLTKRDWIIMGLAPQLTYTYTLSESNVSFYEYDAHGVNITFTKVF